MISIEILSGLWIGNIYSAQNNEFLEDKQIQCVFNCSDETIFPIVTVKYHISPKHITQQNIQQSCQMIDAICQTIFSRIHQYNILIYCADGQSLSEIIVISYVMKYGKMSLEEAIHLFKTKYQNYSVSSPYIEILENYEKFINDSNQNEII